MDPDETKVSHIDLYHKLGKLEGLMETMMTSMSSFQTAMRDIHGRIDAVEARQTLLEQKSSSGNAAQNAIISLGRDLVIPVLMIIVTWVAARSTASNEAPNRQKQVDGNNRTELVCNLANNGSNSGGSNLFNC